jgi:hypothetical protein
MVCVGILIIWFSKNFAIWWAKTVFENRLTLPAHSLKHLTNEEFINKYTNEYPRRIVWIIWLVLSKIFGGMAVVVGLFLILSEVID